MRIYPKQSWRWWLVLFLLAGSILLISYPWAEEEYPQSPYSYTVQDGTSLEEVESVMGPGEKISFEDLPVFYRQEISKGKKGKHYRRWVMNDGMKVTTIHVELRNGLTCRPLIQTDTKNE